jgi:hypothetical protein
MAQGNARNLTTEKVYDIPTNLEFCEEDGSYWILSSFTMTSSKAAMFRNQLIVC